ncbi:type I 3-dehydroquinate dehydratase [Streptomyces sp. NPDC002643]
MRHGGRRARLVAVLTSPGDLDRAPLSAVDPLADGLEVRADLVGDPDPTRLRQSFTGSLTYCLRSHRHGGRHRGGSDERQARLVHAADQYDMVDLEWPDDLTPGVLDRVPPHRRRVSWHGAESERDGLLRLFDTMAAVPAALYVLSVRPTTEGSTSAPVFLSALNRPDVTAFASGPTGFWTRILAPWLGAPVAFGHMGAEGPDGMPSLRQLVVDYGLPALPELDHLYGIAGVTPGRSLSPRLHNTALRTLGLRALYLPYPSRSLSRLLHTTASLGTDVGLPLRGLTVTAPHKEEALALADTASGAARGAGAANVLSLEDGRRHADTTDPAGVLDSLAAAGIDPAGCSTAVVGCGGAGRAVALALRQAGARVTMVNRSQDRGLRAASLLGLPFVPLPGFSARGHSLLVHATPLADRPPFPLTAADPGAVVLELVYRDEPTALMTAARAHGLPTIDGRAVLLIEVREQFRLLTGHMMPADTAHALPQDTSEHSTTLCPRVVVPSEPGPRVPSD